MTTATEIKKHVPTEIEFDDHDNKHSVCADCGEIIWRMFYEGDDEHLPRYSKQWDIITWVDGRSANVRVARYNPACLG
jgi:hypothetical protein